MRSPKTTGLDAPGPGRLIFQAMFSLGPQDSGSPLAALVPIPVGPRKQNQSLLMAGALLAATGALTAANAIERVTSPEQRDKNAKVFIEKHHFFRSNM